MATLLPNRLRYHGNRSELASSRVTHLQAFPILQMCVSHVVLLLLSLFCCVCVCVCVHACVGVPLSSCFSSFKDMDSPQEQHTHIHTRCRQLTDQAITPSSLCQCDSLPKMDLASQTPPHTHTPCRYWIAITSIFGYSVTAWFSYQSQLNEDDFDLRRKKPYFGAVLNSWTHWLEYSTSVFPWQQSTSTICCTTKGFKSRHSNQKPFTCQPILPLVSQLTPNPPPRLHDLEKRLFLSTSIIMLLVKTGSDLRCLS